jgi:hypothetical protein
LDVVVICVEDEEDEEDEVEEEEEVEEDGEDEAEEEEEVEEDEEDEAEEEEEDEEGEGEGDVVVSDVVMMMNGISRGAGLIAARQQSGRGRGTMSIVAQSMQSLGEKFCSVDKNTPGLYSAECSTRLNTTP